MEGVDTEHVCFGHGARILFKTTAHSCSSRRSAMNWRKTAGDKRVPLTHHAHTGFRGAAGADVSPVRPATALVKQRVLC